MTRGSVTAWCGARARFAPALLALLCACAGGMPRIPASPEAILKRADELYGHHKYREAGTLYEQFVERFAGNERADYAQYQLATCHFDGGDYSVAAVDYQVVITNYGYSDWADDALFQIGVCYWRQAPRPERDQQMATDALSRFNQFLQTYPDNPRVPEAREYIVRINQRLAEKALDAARWYRRRKEPRAALIYCDKIIDKYPDNPYWLDALFMKGNILLERGDRKEAAEQFQRIVDYPKDDPLKRAARAKLHEVQK